MTGFGLTEVGAESLRPLWWRGGFPRSFLAENDAASRSWRENFILTFLERDIRMFGVQVPPMTLRRRWNMLAHSHGQIWNSTRLRLCLGGFDVENLRSRADPGRGSRPADVMV